ncbi:MAG TPA: methyltransferase [Patescibacteria group bacterium]|nr:methyltransferase [Patescibacteria group bacterium]
MIDFQEQIDYFESLLSKHGNNYKALDWNSPESQRLRFKVMKELFTYGKKASGVTLLDVGCGFGDLYGYLKSDGALVRHNINYSGCDISPRIIQTAKTKYPDAKFEIKNILEDRHTPKYDYIICSGIFNIRTAEIDDHLAYVKEMIYRASDLATYGVGLNFLSEGSLPIADPENLNTGRYFLFNPEIVLNFCRHAVGKYILRHDYHIGDFTIYLLK